MKRVKYQLDFSLVYSLLRNVYDNHVFQDVVFALAHATGKVGRFTLIERWRNNERLLAPQEYPLKVNNFLKGVIIVF